MPSLPSVNNVIRTDWHFTVGLDDKALTRLFWVYNSGPATVADLIGFLNLLMTQWNTNMKSSWSADVILDSIFGEDLSSPVAAVANSTHAPVAGTDGGSIRSAADCVLMGRRIARRYRGGKPRVYWPGFASGEYQDSQNWAPAHVANAAAGWDLLIAAASGYAGATLSAPTSVNVSYYQGHHLVAYPSGWSFERPTPRAVPLVDLVTFDNWEEKVATQRRRLQRSP